MGKSRRKSPRIQQFQPLAAELAVPDCARICAQVTVATQEPRVMGGGTQVEFNLSTATHPIIAIIDSNIYRAGAVNSDYLEAKTAARWPVGRCKQGKKGRKGRREGRKGGLGGNQIILSLSFIVLRPMCIIMSGIFYSPTLYE